MANYEVAETYTGLRQQLLSFNPLEAGFDPAASNRVWGMMMETGHPGAVITLVVVADGTVSLYFSNGGGIIGLGQHEAPRKAAATLLSAAPDFLELAQQTTVYPLPDEGHTLFYFLTIDGIFSVDAKEDDLGHKRLSHWPLFYLAQGVITQARLVDQQRKT